MHAYARCFTCYRMLFDACRYSDAVAAHAQLISAVAAQHGPARAEEAAAACAALLPSLEGTCAPPVRAALLCARHDRALAHGDLASARMLVSELLSLASPSEHVDINIR